MSTEFSFELIGADAALTEECRAALAGFGTLRMVGPEVTQLGRPPDATLVCLRYPIAEGMTVFAQSRAFRPNVPVVLIGDEIDVDIATELLKCGATEFIVRSSLPELLRPKLERALELRRGPVLDMQEFRALGQSQQAAQQANRRRCFRAQLRGATLRVPGRGAEVQLCVEDLSIPTDGWPGGLGAVADEASVRRLPLNEWSGASSIPLVLHLPGEPAVALNARLVASRRRKTGGTTHLAFQYLATVPGSEAVLRRAWMAAQRNAVA